jgi:hypothetical protein
MHLLYSIYYELTAFTCFEHYLLNFRRRYTTGIWYITCVLCLLPAPVLDSSAGAGTHAHTRTCPCPGSGHSPLARHHGRPCSISVQSVWNSGVNKVAPGHGFIPLLRFSPLRTPSFVQGSVLTRPFSALCNHSNSERRTTTRLNIPYFCMLARDRIQLR